MWRPTADDWKVKGGAVPKLITAVVPWWPCGPSLLLKIGATGCTAHSKGLWVIIGRQCKDQSQLLIDCMDSSTLDILEIKWSDLNSKHERKM